MQILEQRNEVVYKSRYRIPDCVLKVLKLKRRDASCPRHFPFLGFQVRGFNVVSTLWNILESFVLQFAWAFASQWILEKCIALWNIKRISGVLSCWILVCKNVHAQFNFGNSCSFSLWHMRYEKLYHKPFGIKKFNFIRK